MTAILGLISLIGIIVRNGIIMYEYAEELHNVQGLSIRESAMLAGSRRMRPIFLTSCTTALGVLPMIISHDALWMPMGVVIASAMEYVTVRVCSSASSSSERVSLMTSCAFGSFSSAISSRLEILDFRREMRLRLSRNSSLFLMRLILSPICVSR